MLDDRFGEPALHRGPDRPHHPGPGHAGGGTSSPWRRGGPRSRPGRATSTPSTRTSPTRPSPSRGPRLPTSRALFIALDPETGGVRAMIGGRDFRHSKFNRATQALRQAGSSFKPFVYTSALASGIPASHIMVDAPVVLPQVSGEEWKPQNFTEEFLGPITIREGLRRSINMIAIKLGLEVGLETVAQTAQRMGIRTEIERYPSTAIGAAEVIPIQMAEAYSAFATLGHPGPPPPHPQGREPRRGGPLGTPTGTDPGPGLPHRPHHGVHAGGRGGHRARAYTAVRVSGRAPLRGPAGREDGNHQRRHQRLVHGLHPEPDGGRLVRHGPARQHLGEGHGGRGRRPGVGPVHAAGLLRGQHPGLCRFGPPGARNRRKAVTPGS